jgi:hypothetical protein
LDAPVNVEGELIATALATVTVADWDAEPPAPLQLSV